MVSTKQVPHSKKLGVNYLTNFLKKFDQTDTIKLTDLIWTALVLKFTL